VTPADPTHSCYKSAPTTVDEWKSVLKLSTMWDFVAIRQSAIDQLKDQIDSITKIVLARECQVDGWLLAGYEGLVMRAQAISVTEAEVLGLDIAIRLAQVREAVLWRHRSKKASVSHLLIVLCMGNSERISAGTERSQPRLRCTIRMIRTPWRSDRQSSPGVDWVCFRIYAKSKLLYV
jgi:hypothetical protein